MKRLGLATVMLAALAMVSAAADSAEGAVRRVYVSPRSRVYVVNPVRPNYRPRVVITQPVGPMIYSSWNYNSAVIVPHGNHLHVVPTARPIGIWSSTGW
jgi:hypothetical protein